MNIARNIFNTRVFFLYFEYIHVVEINIAQI